MSDSKEEVEWYCTECDAYFMSSESDPECPECQFAEPVETEG